MNDYFASLAASALGLAPRLVPRARGLFEPEQAIDHARTGLDNLPDRSSSVECGGDNYASSEPITEDERSQSALLIDDGEHGLTSHLEVVGDDCPSLDSAASGTRNFSADLSVQAIADRSTAAIAHERLEPVAHDGAEATPHHGPKEIVGSGDRPSYRVFFDGDSVGEILIAPMVKNIPRDIEQPEKTNAPRSEARDDPVLYRRQNSNALGEISRAHIADLYDHELGSRIASIDSSSSSVAQASYDATQTDDRGPGTEFKASGHQRAAYRKAARDEPASVEVADPPISIAPVAQGKAEPAGDHRAIVRHPPHANNVAGAPSDIQITIGRIEVRLPASEPRSRPIATRYAPQVGIAEFKASRDGK